VKSPGISVGLNFTQNLTNNPNPDIIRLYAELLGIFVKVGSIIKSFDFPGNLDCYFIGKVTKVEGDYIHCDTIKQVFDGEEDTDPHPTFCTVKQGLMMFDAKFERVVVLG